MKTPQSHLVVSPSESARGAWGTEGHLYSMSLSCHVPAHLSSSHVSIKPSLCPIENRSEMANKRDTWKMPGSLLPSVSLWEPRFAGNILWAPLCGCEGVNCGILACSLFLTQYVGTQTQHSATSIPRSPVRSFHTHHSQIQGYKCAHVHDRTINDQGNRRQLFEPRAWTKGTG